MKMTLLLSIFMVFAIPIAKAEDIRYTSKTFEAGRKVGMLQATCEYGKMGIISPAVTRQNLSLFLNLIARDHGWDSADFVSWSTLAEHKPFCVRFWPDNWLPDAFRKN